MRRAPKIFLDGRVTVNGKKSHIYEDNAIRLGLLPPGGESGQVLTKLTDSDYDVYWEDVGNLINININPINIANCLFVATNGNDSTAQVGMLHLPWSSVDAASAAASPGQTVIVFPGNYTITKNLVLNYVDLYLYEGVNLNLDASNGIVYGHWFEGNGEVLSHGKINIAGSYGTASRCYTPVRANSFNVSNITLFHTILSFEETTRFDIGYLKTLASYITFNNDNDVIRHYYGKINTHNHTSKATILRENFGIYFSPTTLNVKLKINNVIAYKRDNIYGYIHAASSGLSTINVGIEIDNYRDNIFSPKNVFSSIFSSEESYGNYDVTVKNAILSTVWFSLLDSECSITGRFNLTGTYIDAGQHRAPSLIDCHTHLVKIHFTINLINTSTIQSTVINTTNNKNNLYSGRIINTTIGPEHNSRATIEVGYVDGYLLSPSIIESSDGAYTKDMMIINKNNPSLRAPSTMGGTVRCFNLLSNTPQDNTNLLSFNGLQPSLLVDPILS